MLWNIFIGKDKMKLLTTAIVMSLVIIAPIAFAQVQQHEVQAECHVPKTAPRALQCVVRVYLDSSVIRYRHQFEICVAPTQRTRFNQHMRNPYLTSIEKAKGLRKMFPCLPLQTK